MTTATAETLFVTELFASIQGESTRAGMPCGFVRLAGCNLRCHWCDTPHAFEGGREMLLSQVLDTVAQWRLPLVQVTGGEPLLQPGCVPLVEALLAAGHTTLVETNGTLPITALPENCIRIIDVKCPGSGMSERMHWPNIQALTTRDEVKFVLTDRADYDHALAMIKQHNILSTGAAILFSPVADMLDPQQLAKWMVADSAPARLQLQLHKIIWPADMRGV